MMHKARWIGVIACIASLWLAGCGESGKDETTPTEDDKKKLATDSKHATPVAMDEQQGDTIALPVPSAQSIAGAYRSAHGSLEIAATTTEKVYRFWIAMDESKSCRGSIDGYLTLGDASHASFEVEGCNLAFLFQPQQAQVTESGKQCGNYHKGDCAFSSIYVIREQPTASPADAPTTPLPASTTATVDATNNAANHWSGSYQQLYRSADSQQCEGWKLEFSGSASAPAISGIWYHGDCSATATVAKNIQYNQNTGLLQLELSDSQGQVHYFFGDFKQGQPLQGHWK